LDKAVSWTIRARKDLLKEISVINEKTKDPLVAEKWATRVFAQSRRLAYGADTGRLLPDANDLPRTLRNKQLHIKEIIVENFRMIYTIDDQEILILRFIRCSRLLRNAYKPDAPESECQ
jgi:hypothetical protein